LVKALSQHDGDWESESLGPYQKISVVFFFFLYVYINSKNYRKKAKEVSDILNTAFTKRFGDRPEYASIVHDYTKKEIHLNGLQFFAGYLSGEREDWEKHIQVPMALEMTMIWAYKTNRILDKKQEVWNDEENIKQTVLDHDLMHSLIIELLDEYESEMGKRRAEPIVKLIHELMSKLALGFWVERAHVCARFSELEEILSQWDEMYLRRNVLFNTVYDVAPLIGYAVAVKDFSILQTYQAVIPERLRFSNVAQIINDLGDFGEDVDILVKSYQDKFADIRNGIVTFPVRRLINEKLIQKAFKKPRITLTKRWQKSVRLIVFHGELEKEILQLADESFQAHKQFFQLHITSQHPLLLRCYGLLMNNKFLDQRLIAQESEVFRQRAVLCTASGNEIGVEYMDHVHETGSLHKTFSVLMKNERGEIFLQKNGEVIDSIFGHNVSGEDVLRTATGLLEKLNMACALKKKFSFVYKISMMDHSIEHAFHTVIVGSVKGHIGQDLNSDQYVWMTDVQLRQDILNEPQRYAPVLRIVLERMGLLKEPTQMMR